MPPEVELSGKRMLELFAPQLSAIRERLFGSPHPPFPGDYGAALKWIRGQRARLQRAYPIPEEDRAAALRLLKEEIRPLVLKYNVLTKTSHSITANTAVLEYAEPGFGGPTFFAVPEDSPLAKLARLMARLARRTGLSATALLDHVLTGSGPCLPVMRVHRTFSSPDRISGLRLEMHGRDPGWKEMRTAYKFIKDLRGSKKGRRLSDRQLRLLRLGEELGGEPVKGKTDFWLRLQSRCLEEDINYDSWQGVRSAYLSARSKVEQFR